MLQSLNALLHQLTGLRLKDPGVGTHAMETEDTHLGESVLERCSRLEARPQNTSVDLEGRWLACRTVLRSLEIELMERKHTDRREGQLCYTTVLQSVGSRRHQDSFDPRTPSGILHAAQCSTRKRPKSTMSKAQSVTTLRLGRAGVLLMVLRLLTSILAGLFMAIDMERLLRGYGTRFNGLALIGEYQKGVSVMIIWGRGRSPKLSVC